MSFQCKVSGCQSEKHRGKGYCKFHYGRLLKGVDLNKPKREKNKGKVCKIDGCQNKAVHRLMCNKHYQRLMRKGDPNDFGKGRVYGSGKEWHVAPHGYIVRFDPSNPNAGPNGQVYQHRQVMSEMIGRPLRSHENVHHVNGDRADNRPQNLELWSRSQPAGQRITDRVAWALEFLTIENLEAAKALDASSLQNLADALKTLQTVQDGVK
jgi:hypothetical protein